MAGFDEWASVRRLHDGTGRFTLTRDLTYRSDAGSVYVVKRGFNTDLASIPRFLWSLLPPHDRYLSAAILHDYFCESEWVSRLDGDKLFLEAMGHSNVANWKRKIIYLSVRLYAKVNGLK